MALLGENSPGFIAGLYGIALAGGVYVPLSSEIERDRLELVCRTATVRVALTVGRLPARLESQLGDPAEEIGAAEMDDPSPSVHARRTDLAAMMLTSGSSGTPKLVMLTHGNILSNAASIIEYLAIRPSDRALALLPFYHAFGHSVLQTHVLSGATLVRAGTVLFPNSIVEAIDRHAVTSFSGVPEVHRMLLARSDLGKRPLPSLRYMSVAGGALDAQSALEAARRIAPAQFFVMYGQTEATARISFLEPAELERRAGSIGRGIPGVEVQVVDADGKPVAPGELGELRARGPNIMLGYCNAPEDTARAVRSGWLHTGDLATVDYDGYVFIRGRASEWFKVAGYRVHPAEIETAVGARLPAQNIVVVGCETASSETRLAMFVQPLPERASLTVDEVMAVCREELPRYKVPVYVEMMERIPLNGAMKADRAALRRRAVERLVHSDSPASGPPEPHFLHVFSPTPAESRAG